MATPKPIRAGTPSPTESSTRVSADANAEESAPIRLECWVMVLDAQEDATRRGLDPCSVLASFALTRAKWDAATAWWSRYFKENATRKGGELYARYVQLRAELHARAK